MKKKSTFLFVAFIILFLMNASGATIQVSAPADLYTTYSSMNDGDVIELTTDGGAYTWGTKLGSTAKSVKVKAAAGLSTRPTISLPAQAAVFSANVGTSPALTPSYEFDGLEFIGNSTITNFIIAGKTLTGGDFTVTINNCKFSGFSNAIATYFSYANSQATNQITKNYGKLKVSNTLFLDGYSVYSVGSVVGSNTFCTANEIEFTNCYFKGILRNTIAHNTSSILSASLLFNHCTFDGCANVANYKELSIGSTGTTGGPTVVKNCLFANRGASTTANILGAAGAESNLKNAVYYTGTGTLDAIYPIAILGDYVTAGLNVDPVIGTNFEATASAYYNAGSDGKTIGYVATGITTAVSKPTTANNFTVAQSGTNFTLKGIKDAAYTVYSVIGSQVATGVTKGGEFKLSANKGIYILKTNEKVAKFTVK